MDNSAKFDDPFEYENGIKQTSYYDVEDGITYLIIETIDDNGVRSTNKVVKSTEPISEDGPISINNPQRMNVKEARYTIFNNTDTQRSVATGYIDTNGNMIEDDIRVDDTLENKSVG